jgi:hypothetical protein
MNMTRWRRVKRRGKGKEWTKWGRYQVEEGQCLTPSHCWSGFKDCQGSSRRLSTYYIPLPYGWVLPGCTSIIPWRNIVGNNFDIRLFSTWNYEELVDQLTRMPNTRARVDSWFFLHFGRLSRNHFRKISESLQPFQ